MTKDARAASFVPSACSVYRELAVRDLTEEVFPLPERVYCRDSRRLEVPDIAGDDGQAVLQRRGGDE